MLPNYEDVQNLKQLILLSQDSRTAQQMLLDMLSPCMAELEQGLCYPQLIARTLTIIQVYCEFDLPWQTQFSTCFEQMHVDGLYEQFIARIDHFAMQCRPSKQALAQLIQWQPCRQSPLLPIKQEIVQAVHQLCHTAPAVQRMYWFDDGRHSCRLYWQNGCWHWQDLHKQLIWTIQ